MTDAMYFRVSSYRQTAENQFAELLDVAERDGSGRSWELIRELLKRVIVEEQTQGGIKYSVDAAAAEILAKECVYVEQGKSAKRGAKLRPMYERMKRDGHLRKFDRLLVWHISHLGTDMLQTLQTAGELAELGTKILALHGHIDSIDQAMGKIMLALYVGFAEFDNEHRSETIKAGMATRKARGHKLGRKPVPVDIEQAFAIKAEHPKWGYRVIAQAMGVNHGTLRRRMMEARTAVQAQTLAAKPGQV